MALNLLVLREDSPRFANLPAPGRIRLDGRRELDVIIGGVRICHGASRCLGMSITSGMFGKTALVIRSICVETRRKFLNGRCYSYVIGAGARAIADPTCTGFLAITSLFSDTRLSSSSERSLTGNFTKSMPWILRRRSAASVIRDWEYL
jgi:hypothetical protein